MTMINFEDLEAEAYEHHRKAWSELRGLVEKISQLEADNANLKGLLERQCANFREHIARRDQQLIDAAASLDAVEKQVASLTGEKQVLSDQLARFQLARELMNEARFGASPFVHSQLEERRPLALEVN